MDVVLAVPVKPFADAKRRLASVLSPEGRRSLGRLLAMHTVVAVEGAGARPLVVAADAGVSAWARAHHLEVLVDSGAGLDRAARQARAWALDRGLAWGILHADLPLLSRSDLMPAVRSLASGGTVLAPSTDGGTSLLGAARVEFPFAYGPGSFRRHLGRLADGNPLVLSGVGLSLDLDEPDDLDAALRHPAGAWLAPVVAPRTRRGDE